MCNLYSMRKPRDEAARSFRVFNDRTGNQPPLPALFPDQLAPVIRMGDGGREMLNMRWGMPCLPVYGGAHVTKIRNTKSPHWRRWLAPVNRCLVPANSYCEYADTKPRKTPTWFALDDERPFFGFAGIWTMWHSMRGTKAEPVKGEHLLFGFLTCDANAVVAPVHPKAMPAILTTEEECEAWLKAPAEEALKLQRPLPGEALRVVATGERRDELVAT